MRFVLDSSDLFVRRKFILQCTKHLRAISIRTFRDPVELDGSEPDKQIPMISEQCE